MKLCIITQAVDSTHSALGFFVEWIKSFRAHSVVSHLSVVSFDHATESIEGVELHRVSEKDRWARMRIVWNLLKASDWDVLFVHMTPIWCIACWSIVALKRKKMVLWYTHGSSSFSLRLACLLCHEVYTATRDAFPIRSSTCFAVGHGIPEAFGLIERTNANGHRYLSVGRLSQRKRVVETLEFFSKIRAVDPSATLTWVGSGMGDVSYEFEVQQAIHRLGLESSVAMVGSVLSQKTPEIFAQHDLLLHLSATGSLDKVVIEALMAGCAVFSTNAATAEGLGEEWVYRGVLDDDAVMQAIKLAKQTIPFEIRAEATKRFGLTSFIDRLCRMMSMPQHKQ
jgi:glycosyltransferase involved in cell wall biosynthesis